MENKTIELDVVPSNEIVEISKDYVFYLPGKLGDKTVFSKIDLWNKFQKEIKLNDILTRAGFEQNGFNEATFHVDEENNILRFGSRLSMSPTLHNNINTKIKGYVFKTLTSKKFPENPSIKVKKPSHIQDQLLTNNERSEIIKELNKVKTYIQEYSTSYTEDPNEKKKKKFGRKSEILNQSIISIDSIVNGIKSSTVSDFELIILIRFLLYQCNKKR